MLAAERKANVLKNNNLGDEKIESENTTTKNETENTHRRTHVRPHTRTGNTENAAQKGINKQSRYKYKRKKNTNTREHQLDYLKMYKINKSNLESGRLNL